MSVTRLLTQAVMMTLLLAPETMERSPVTTGPMSRVTLVQQQACTRAPDTGGPVTTVCSCPGERDTQGPAYLGVRMQGFLLGPQTSSKVSSLVVESCADLVLNLDLRGLNLSTIRTVIRNTNKVVLETVLADYRHSFAQTFHLAIKKVKNATLSGVELVSSVRITAENVGSLSVTDSTFSSLPRAGLVATGVSSLAVTGCTFNAIQSKSVVVRQVRELIMMDNQFGVSSPGLDILSYSDSVTYVNILCNRLLGSPVSPDCQRPSDDLVTPETRVTTAWVTEAGDRAGTDHGVMDGLATLTGVSLILAILVYTGYLAYTHRSILVTLKAEVVTQLFNTRPGVTDLNQEFLPPASSPSVKIPCPPPVPVPVTSNGPVTNGGEPRISVANVPEPPVAGLNPGPVLSTPVWLQEIKSNEIFNKRKKISSFTDVNDDNIENEDEDNQDVDEYPDVTILHKTIDKNLLSKKEYVY